jgi:hypothetical protein
MRKRQPFMLADFADNVSRVISEVMRFTGPQFIGSLLSIREIYKFGVPWASGPRFARFPSQLSLTFWCRFKPYLETTPNTGMERNSHYVLGFVGGFIWFVHLFPFRASQPFDRGCGSSRHR